MPLSPEEEEAIRREFEASRKSGHEEKAADQGPQFFEQSPKSNVQHVVGVVSGKGGVGKSLVCGMLAVELKRRGYRVGILDADLTGPSIPKMFGLSGVHATAWDNLLMPSETVGGIKIMSANLVLENETDPVIWRGPVVAGALQQFWSQCAWGDLDFLLIDMPPGTSDVALTVFQSLPIEGIVIVSTPQDLVQMVVGKAVKMAAMMDIPVFGIVENMSYVECPDCGKRIEPFGPSKLAETAGLYGIDVLGRLPMTGDFARMCDCGAIETALPEDLLPDAVLKIETVAAFFDDANSTD